MKTDLQFTLTVTNKKTGKKTNFNLIDEKTIQILHPKTNEVIAEIHIDDEGIARLKNNDSNKWPDDAAKCLLECTKECHGSYFCAMGCAALCATIIIG